MRPRIPITSREFVYSDAANTDIRRLFRKIRREQAAQAAAKVVPIAKRSNA